MRCRPQRACPVFGPHCASYDADRAADLDTGSSCDCRRLDMEEPLPLVFWEGSLVCAESLRKAQQSRESWEDHSVWTERDQQRRWSQEVSNTDRVVVPQVFKMTLCGNTNMLDSDSRYASTWSESMTERTLQWTSSSISVHLVVGTSFKPPGLTDGGRAVADGANHTSRSFSGPSHHVRHRYEPIEW